MTRILLEAVSSGSTEHNRAGVLLLSSDSEQQHPNLCHVPQALPAPRPSCQTHSHTQSRCQPMVSLPAPTNRSGFQLQMMFRNLWYKFLWSWADTATLPPVWTNDSAQSTAPSQDLTAGHPVGMTLTSCGLSTSSDTSSTANLYFLHPSPSRMAHVLYKERCRIKAISGVLSKSGKKSFHH